MCEHLFFGFLLSYTAGLSDCFFWCMPWHPKNINLLVQENPAGEIEHNVPLPCMYMFTVYIRCTHMDTHNMCKHIRNISINIIQILTYIDHIPTYTPPAKEGNWVHRCMRSCGSLHAGRHGWKLTREWFKKGVFPKIRYLSKLQLIWRSLAIGQFRFVYVVISMACWIEGIAIAMHASWSAKSWWDSI